jgi:hypothetical protein
MHDLEQFKDKKFRKKFILTETLKWWLILFAVFFVLNAINISPEQSFDNFLSSFFEFNRISTIIFFCLFASFLYSLIKLSTAKKNIKSSENH